MKQSLVALDTCIVMRLAKREHRSISARAKHALEKATVFVPSFVALEIDFMREKGKTDRTSLEYLALLAKDFEVETRSAYAEDICRAAARLHWTRDPFDRLIVAEVDTHKLSLITSDRTIQEHYKKAIW